ncbi:MAG: TadE family protein [Candidatus Korobacteraceae bacterium]|jgi:Flp pilus assembly protein TadG
MRKTNDSGQTLVEFAFSLSIFLVLLMGTIEFGFMFSTKVTLQNAVRQAGRYAVTGQCITGPSGCSENRYNSIITTLEGASDGLINSGNAGSDVSITCTDLGGGCPDGAGGPNDLVVITVTYPYHFLTGPISRFFPSGYTIKVSSSFKNEMFPPSQS